MGGNLANQVFGLDGEVVDRQVRWRHRQCLGQVLVQLHKSLAWQRVHQIKIERVKCVGGFLQRGDRLSAVVHATQRLQVSVVEALHPHRQARDPRAANAWKPSFQTCPDSNT